MKRLMKVLGGAIFIGLLILMVLVFVPRTYDVSAFNERPGSLFWKMDSNSRIGYTRIEASGDSLQTPIIYLHGGPGGTVSDQVIESYRPLSELGHDLYFYDQIGSGHSSRLDDINAYTIDRHVRDLAEIVSRISEDKVILIGQSWGAMLAIEYLYDHQEFVEQIIMTNPGPLLPISASHGKAKAPDSLGMNTPKYTNREGNQKAYNMRAKIAHKYAIASGKKLVPDGEMDDFFTLLNTELSRSTVCDGSTVEPFRGGGGFYCHVMTVKDLSNRIDRKQELLSMKTPITIIKGQCDSKPLSFTQEYLDLFQNSAVTVIKNSGHNLHVNKNQELLGLITSQLKN